MKGIFTDSIGVSVFLVCSENENHYSRSRNDFPTFWFCTVKHKEQKFDTGIISALSLVSRNKTYSDQTLVN